MTIPARTPAETWSLAEAELRPDPHPEFASIFAISNGYLGFRGDVGFVPGEASRGTFVNGFHETWNIQHAEDAYGLARVGQTIVDVPDATEFEILVDGTRVSVASGTVESYRRELSFQSGLLELEMIWVGPAGQRIHIFQKCLVSLTSRNLGMIDLTVTSLEGPADLVVRSLFGKRRPDLVSLEDGSSLVATDDPRQASLLSKSSLAVLTETLTEDSASCLFATNNSEMSLEVSATLSVDTANSVAIAYDSTLETLEHRVSVNAKTGVPTRFVKCLTYRRSPLLGAATLADPAFLPIDPDLEQERQRELLTDFWQHADIEIGGALETQQAIRWTIFQLLQASALVNKTGVPAKGLSGSGYDGHYFWDTEIYLLPFLTYTRPEAAKEALGYRYLLLDAARERAKVMAQKGALFPWRTISGEESSAYYPAGTAQYHIDADIAHAVANYTEVTGDVDFMAEQGIDILVETARLWEDLGFWRTDGDSVPQFHIYGVTGPDEYTAVVNDNFYTNVMARKNLRSAVHWLEWLREHRPQDHAAVFQRLNLDTEETNRFAWAAEGMFIPFDERLGIHPQDEGFLSKKPWNLAETPADRFPLLLNYHPLVIYRHQVIKQADTVLALLLAGNEFTAEEKRADFDYYRPLTTGDSSLSAVAESIIAAEVGHAELAYAYFKKALRIDLLNRHHNTDQGLHIASLGGIWNTLVMGFGGMRDHQGTLSFDPRLPREWDQLAYHLCVRGSRLDVKITPGQLTLRFDSDSELSVTVQGQTILLRAREPQTIALRPTEATPSLPPLSSLL